MSRAIGDLDFKKNRDVPAKDQMVSAFPDISITERSAADEFIILACDGLWDLKTSEETVTEIHEKIYGGGVKPSMANFVVGVENLVDSCWAKSRFAL